MLTTSGKTAKRSLYNEKQDTSIETNNEVKKQKKQKSVKSQKKFKPPNTGQILNTSGKTDRN